MIEAIKEIAVEAGEAILKRRELELDVKQKGVSSDVVTGADIEAEKLILSKLRDLFPDDSFWSEESEKKGGGSEYRWVIDPLDGTTAYLAGLDYYGVSIGRLKEGRPWSGVIYLPARRELFWGQVGEGAYLNGSEIKVSKETELEKVFVGFDLWHIGGRKQDVERLLIPLADRVRYPAILACTVVGLGMVAKGVFGGYIHRAYAWDFAAGVAIIEAAGGKVTDIRGEEIDWSVEEMMVVASNGRIHNELIERLRL